VATREDVGELLQVLHALYPHSSPIAKGLSEDSLAEAVARLARPWHAILGDLPADLLTLAVKQLGSSDREFFPPAGVVRQAALDLIPGPGDGKSAGEAWEEVRLALSRGEHGYHRGYYEWSSDLVERAFNGVGGWHYFRQALAESVMADRAHFMRIYSELLEREEKARREAPAVVAYRRAMLGHDGREDRSKRPRMIAVDVEEERRRLAAGEEQPEAQDPVGPGEAEAAVGERPEAVARAVQGLASRWRMPDDDGRPEVHERPRRGGGEEG
jgi:hypothetical protein